MGDLQAAVGGVATHGPDVTGGELGDPQVLPDTGCAQVCTDWVSQ